MTRIGTPVMRRTCWLTGFTAVLICGAAMGAASSHVDAGTDEASQRVSSGAPTMLAAAPEISLEPPSAAPGETVRLTIVGFAARSVTAAICGNEARRGSADCDMRGSVGVVLDPTGGPTVALVPASAPPSPCPCVVRVATADFRQIAVAPLELQGHESADLVDSAQPSGGILAAIAAQRAESGIADRIRGGLGGSIDYDVTVTVTNQTAAPIDGVVVAGSFGKAANHFLGDLSLLAPNRLEPGQSWQQVVSVSVPSWSINSVVWRIEAAAGIRVSRAVAETEQRPTLLIGLAVVLVVDLGLLGIRRRVRDRDRAPAGRTNAVSSRIPARSRVS